MDKYEYKVRAEEIKQLIAQGEYPQAVEIADTIDWRRVKSVMMLCTISDLYKINRRYEEARDLLLMAYERRPNSRNIVYSLCELSIKTEEYVQAVEYYKEFVQIAPQDSDRYVLQYKLYVAQEVSLEERIEVLEELKRHDYKEKWVYELAYLYHKIGLGTRCVEECDELIMMMGSGRYVTKAMELKMLHEPLTPQQQEKYDHRNDMMKARELSQEYAAEEPTENAEAETAEGTEAGQQEKAESPVSGDTQIYEPVRMGNDGRYFAQEYAAEESGAGQDEAAEAEDAVELDGADSDQGEEPADGQDLEAAEPEQTEPEEEYDIRVKTMNVGEYDTINLQAQLARGLKEILDTDQQEGQAGDDVSADEEPVPESVDTESLDFPEIDEVDADDLEPEPEQMESSEVFFGETGEISAEELPAEEPEEPESDAEAETGAEEPEPDGEAEVIPEEIPGDAAGRTVMEQMRSSAMDSRSLILPEPPREMAHVLSQESDGQISMVLPETGQVEKQITGQLSIEDILAEWERVKKANEEKRKEEVRQHVLQQTGPMFTEFETAVRDEILAKTPKAEDIVVEPETIHYVPLSAGEVLTPEEPEKAPEEPKAEVPVEDESVETETGDAFEEIVEPDTAGGEATAEEPEETEAGAGEEAAEKAEETSDAGEEPAVVEVLDLDGDMTPGGETEPKQAVDESEKPAAEPESGPDEYPEEDWDAAPEAEAESDKEAKTADEADSPAEEDAEPSVEELFDTDDDTEKNDGTDRPKVRALTREEKELYAPFIQSRKAREQIATAIDNISMAAYTGNVIVTGEEGMDTLTLARNMIREVQSSDSNFSGKVAKISGHALNKKDVAATLEQLHSGALIIQRASEMEADTAKNLRDALQQESLGIVIVLVDNRKAMNRFLRENEQLRELFTARVDVEAMSNDALVAFGRQYAREMEYSISDLGILELHRSIGDRQTLDHIVTAPEVKKIVDDAIRHANRKTPGHFFDILLNRRYDDEDMIVLTDKDFA